MKVGLSTYSLSRKINKGELGVIEAIEWIAENGGEHVEIVPSGFSLSENPELIDQIKARTAALGLDISSYTIGANFLTETEEEYKAEIERVKKEVDIGGALGVKFMRHDAGSRPKENTTVAQFEQDLPKLIPACQEIADHAKQYGITTSVENHGYHVQGSERVHRLVLGVNRDNFRTTIDIGNFMCADEDPVIAVSNNIGIASLVHFKDFYCREPERDPGEGWFTSRKGRFLRGAIVGQGDINIPKVMKLIKDSGFDGYISIEFEGMEDCQTGSRIGMANVKRIWENV